MACEYCEDETPLIVNTDVLVFIDSDTPQLVANYHNEKLGWLVAYKRIYQCPMCGEELGDE